MKKLSAVLVTMALIAVVCLTFAMSACTYDSSLKEGNAHKASSLKVREDGTFVVMQLTDLHLTTNGSYGKDRQTLKWVEEAIDTVKPDLVEVTGDAVADHPSKRNKALLALANIFEQKQVYWAYTFGNHDGEHAEVDGKHVWIGKEGKQNSLIEYAPAAAQTLDLQAGKAFFGDNTAGNLELYELLKGYEYSLLVRDSEELKNPDAMGVGNYVIELENSDGETVFAIFHFDTHGKFYIDPTGNDKGADGYSDQGYVGLTKAQTDWYESKVKQYSKAGVKSAIFMHAASYSYREALEIYDKTNEFGVPQFKDYDNVKESVIERGLLVDKFADEEFSKLEAVCGPYWDEGLSQIIANNPSTSLISVGHDHNNNLTIAYDLTALGGKDKLLLSYGRVSGVNAWARDIPIGATVFTIDTTAQTTEDTYDVRVVYPSFKYAEKGNR